MSEPENHLKRIEERIKAIRLERQLIINKVKQIRTDKSDKDLRQQAEDSDYLAFAKKELAEIKSNLEELESQQKEYIDKSIDKSIEESNMTLVHTPVKKTDEASGGATHQASTDNRPKKEEIDSQNTHKSAQTQSTDAGKLGPFATAQQKRTENLGAIPKISLFDSNFNLQVKRKRVGDDFLKEKSEIDNDTNIDLERRKREEMMNTFYATGEYPPNMMEDSLKYSFKRPEPFKHEISSSLSSSKISNNFTPQKQVTFMTEDTHFDAPNITHSSSTIQGSNINDSLNLKQVQFLRSSPQYDPISLSNNEQDVFSTPNIISNTKHDYQPTQDLINTSHSSRLNRNTNLQRPQRLQRPSHGQNFEDSQQERIATNNLNRTYTINNNPTYRSDSMEVLTDEEDYFNPNSSQPVPRNRNSNIDRNQAKARPIFLKRLSNIPEFDGESFENMKKFLDKVETLYYSSTNNAESDELFEHVLLKVNGEARDLIVSLNNFDWIEIKNALIKHYTHLCNKNLVTTQLENIRQGEKETLTEYSERARKLLRTKNAMYSNLTQEQREEHNRIAYKAYMKGLTNTKLKERVVTRGAASLDTAIENAIDMELDTQNQIQSNELFCKACRNVGHRERDCRSRGGSNNAILNLVSALRNLGPLNLSRNPNLPLSRNLQNANFRRNLNSWNSNNFSSNNRAPLGANRSFEFRNSENREIENRNWNPNNFNRPENNMQANQQMRRNVPSNFNRNRNNFNPSTANNPNNINSNNNRPNQVNSISTISNMSPLTDAKQEN